MTDNHFLRAVDARARHFARLVEDAGNFIGPNDMPLANKLWSASGDLRRYGKEQLAKINNGTEFPA